MFITIADYLLLPLYVVVIYYFVNRFRDKHYPPGHPWRRYFKQGFTLKIIGALFIGLIYQYYYRGGDTANYFRQSVIINSAFFESPVKWVNLLLNIPEWYDADYIGYTSRLYWYNTSNAYTIISIASIAGILSFNTFLISSLLFAVLSFTGIWALFRTFAMQYPQYTKYVAWAVLFIPSTFIWGSGIFKDTICMFALGWMTYCTFQMLIARNFSATNILYLIASFYLTYLIKLYILIAFIPALLIWVLFQYSQRIKTGFIRSFVKVGAIGISSVLFLVVMGKYSNELGQYSLENIQQTSEITRNYIYRVSGEDGSGYDIGEVNLTSPMGVLKTFPKAVNIGLFRPYVWEAKKIIVFANALEALLFLMVTLKVLFSLGPRTVWRTVSKDATIQFCLIFAIIFAFAVGLSSGNFGALSRYRIPALPFYSLAMLLIYYKNRPISKNILSLR